MCVCVCVCVCVFVRVPAVAQGIHWRTLLTLETHATGVLSLVEWFASDERRAAVPLHTRALSTDYVESLFSMCRCVDVAIFARARALSLSRSVRACLLRMVSVAACCDCRL